MKKKITSLFVIVALALGTLALAGCSWFEANSISFVNPPATTYVLGETGDLEFTIEVSDSTGTNQYKYSENKNLITVSNFSTETAGTRTAYVRYDNKFQLSFTYTVLDGRYSGGTGTQTDPYLVSTPAQFQNLLTEKSFKYYKITRNIDFTDFDLRMANAGRQDSSSYWVGSIDGSSHALLNINNVLLPNGDACNKYNELFGNVGTETEDFIMKNLTIRYAATGEKSTSGLIYSNGYKAKIYFENVTLEGYIDYAANGSSSVGGFIGFLNRWIGDSKVNGRDALVDLVSFTDCNCNLQFLNTYGVSYIGGFISTSATLQANTIKFTNCNFGGRIEGANTDKATSVCGAFVSDAGGYAKGAFSFQNCSITSSATIIKTSNGDIGEIYSAGVKDDPNITSSANYVDSSLKQLRVAKENGKLVAEYNGSETLNIDGYIVVASGSMTRWPQHGGNSGGFCFKQPVYSTDIVDGKLSKTIYTFTCNNTVDDEDIPTDYDDLCGSRLLQLNGNTITYYCKSVCKTASISKYMVIALSNGVAVAYGSTGA